MEIHYTDSYEKACELRDQGYEPIECAFGGYGSVLGPFAMDHHGTESHRSGVAIRACLSHHGALANDSRFVVTGTPDADAILSIIALAGLLSQDAIPSGFPELVDLHDRNPIGLDLTQEEHGLLLLAFNQCSLPRKTPGFELGIERMVAILTHGLDAEEERRALGAERSRQRRANESIRGVYLADGSVLEFSEATPWTGEGLQSPSVALTLGAVWGFDVWYLYAPVVVSYSGRLEKITIGCPNNETAERLFGPGGLLALYPVLGEGWGGREAVGGSPRGEKRTFEQAGEVAKRVASLLGTQDDFVEESVS